MQSRFEDRHELALACQVQTQPGESAATMIVPKRVKMTDLSLAGCAIESSRLPLETEDRVAIGIDDAGPIDAEVRWSRRGEACGLRFMRPLTEIEIERIASAKDRRATNAAKRPIKASAMRSRNRSVC